MTKQLIRVEWIDGGGPWRGIDEYAGDEARPWLFEMCPDMSTRHSSFNTPWEDNLNMISGLHYCAYRSLEMLERWITPEEMKILIANKFTVWLYEVSEWQEGRDNTIFRREDVVDKRDLTELFK